MYIVIDFAHGIFDFAPIFQASIRKRKLEREWSKCSGRLAIPLYLLQNNRMYSKCNECICEELLPVASHASATCQELFNDKAAKLQANLGSFYVYFSNVFLKSVELEKLYLF